MISVFAQAGLVDGIDEVVDTNGVTGWDWLWAFLFVVSGIVIASTARRYVRRYGKRSDMPDNIVDLIGTLIMWSVVPIATILGLTFIGLDVEPLFLLLLLVLIVLAIGGRTLLEAFGAGVLLQTRSPFVPGDYVTVHDVTGTVVQVDSRVVVLDTRDGRRVSVPNPLVLSNPIENMTLIGHRMSKLYLDVEYGTNLEFAIDTALEAIRPLAEVLDEPAPSCRVNGFEDSSVRLALRFWHGPTFIEEIDAVDVASRAAYLAFHEAGIVFAFPNVTEWKNTDRTERPAGPTDQTSDARRQTSDVGFGAPASASDDQVGLDEASSHGEDTDAGDG